MSDAVHAWEPLLTPRDVKFLETRPVQERGMGTKPALIVVDMQYTACGDKDEDLLTMVKRWPSGCGHEAWAAIRRQIPLLDTCRQAAVPIIYTRYVPQLIRFDGFTKKRGDKASQPVLTDQKWQIVSEIAPKDEDIVLDKSYASVLFGTPLLSWLIAMGIDTTILVGNSTGGCVRASAVDLTTHNYNVVVVEDCVFDRLELSHAAALLDLWMKYCDVVFSEDVMGHLAGLRQAGGGSAADAGERVGERHAGEVVGPWA
jgi:nicotinamidase-related amidase